MEMKMIFAIFSIHEIKDGGNFGRNSENFSVKLQLLIFNGSEDNRISMFMLRS
jgi:hypothetical protein